MKTFPKLKTGIYLLSMLLSFNGLAYSQQKIKLNVKYNSEDNTYGIYAKANFSKRNFLWGPSQITLIFPAYLPDEKLRVKNLDGGTWEDNSLVFAPEIDPKHDFHGFASAGNKTDLVENIETLLFYFTLPVRLEADEITIFDNNNGPKSSDRGMKGGDFQNSIIDEQGRELYESNEKNIVSVNKEAINENPTKKLDFNLFPNVTKEKFSVSLEGVEDQTQVELLVSTDSGRIIMQENSTKKTLSERVFKIPASIPSQSLVVRIKIANETIGKRLILERE